MLLIVVIIIIIDVVLITSAKEVSLHFVCLQDYAKTTQPILTKFGEKVAQAPGKNSLNFGGSEVMILLRQGQCHSVVGQCYG